MFTKMGALSNGTEEGAFIVLVLGLHYETWPEDFKQKENYSSECIWPIHTQTAKEKSGWMRLIYV